MEKAVVFLPLPLDRRRGRDTDHYHTRLEMEDAKSLMTGVCLGNVLSVCLFLPVAHSMIKGRRCDDDDRDRVDSFSFSFLPRFSILLLSVV